MLRSDSLSYVGAGFPDQSQMLVELRAENYAVIDHAIAVFGPGLNLLTGETGAGKSILVDALALLMGGKSSAEVVRHGADKAVVACVFESTPGAETILEENGIDAEGNEIILRREILSTGKGRVFVNNQPATVAVLKQLAPELALVHAQSETLTSFDQAQQRILLDRFGGLSTEAVAEAYARWRDAADEARRTAPGRAGPPAHGRSVELPAARRSKPPASSPAKTRPWKPRSASWPTPKSSTPPPWAPSSSSTRAARRPKAALRAALRNVEELARYDSRFTEAAQQLASARATVGDVSASLRDYAEGINASPSASPRSKTASPCSTASSASTARPSPRSSPSAKR